MELVVQLVRFILLWTIVLHQLRLQWICNRQKRGGSTLKVGGPLAPKPWPCACCPLPKGTYSTSSPHPIPRSLLSAPAPLSLTLTDGKKWKGIALTLLKVWGNGPLDPTCSSTPGNRVKNCEPEIIGSIYMEISKPNSVGNMVHRRQFQSSRRPWEYFFAAVASSAWAVSQYLEPCKIISVWRRMSGIFVAILFVYKACTWCSVSLNTLVSLLTISKPAPPASPLPQGALSLCSFSGTCSQLLLFLSAYFLWPLCLSITQLAKPSLSPCIYNQCQGNPSDNMN